MTRDTITRLCAAMPHATQDNTFGPAHDNWKVGGKLFAIHGPTGVSVKTDSVDTARMLIDAGVAVRAPYCHASWVNVPHDADVEELTHRIGTSYALVLASLPRKMRDALGAG